METADKATKAAKVPCICPNTGCPYHGDCEKCKKHHWGMPYCTSKLMKKIVLYRMKKYGPIGRPKEKEE